jgi:hypothetical protein
MNPGAPHWGLTATSSLRPQAPRFFTIGHSTRSAEELLALLRAAEVPLLVDVRRFPASRRHPQFAQEALSRTLEEAGIAYRHEPGLGGRRQPLPLSPNGGGGMQGSAGTPTTWRLRSSERRWTGSCNRHPAPRSCARRRYPGAATGS